MKLGAPKNHNFEPELSVYDNFNIRAEYFNLMQGRLQSQKWKRPQNIFLKLIPFRFEIVDSCVWE